MPTATLNTDSRFGPPPDLHEVRGGWLGVRSYRVDTEEPTEAMAAAPAMGSAWGAGAPPTLVVVDRKSRYISGKNVGGTPPTTGGTTVVQLQYETPGLYGRLPVPNVATKFTVPRTEQTVITVHFGVVPPSPSPGDIGLNNDEGASKNVGRLLADVYTYTDNAGTIDWARLNELLCLHALNDANLTLPPLVGGGPVWAFTPGQVQYQGYTPTLIPATSGGTELLELVHHLAIAEDWRVYWEKLDTKRRTTGIIFERQIYHRLNMGGLW